MGLGHNLSPYNVYKYDIYYIKCRINRNNIYYPILNPTNMRIENNMAENLKFGLSLIFNSQNFKIRNFVLENFRSTYSSYLPIYVSC